MPPNPSTFDLVLFELPALLESNVEVHKTWGVIIQYLGTSFGIQISLAWSILNLLGELQFQLGC